MTGRLHGKVALVMGAGSRGPGWGNGKAAAVLFAREGASLFIVDINASAVEETGAIIADEGGVVTSHTADATDAAQVRAAVDACCDRFGGIDVLHNNIGGAASGGPVEMDEEVWDANIELNLKPAFLACKHVLPVMEKAGGGAIVNVSSTAAVSVPETPLISYQAGKAGLIQLSRGIALQYARKGIRCNCILPGKILTPLVEVRLKEQHEPEEIPAILEQRSRMVPLGRMGDAWDVAYAALFLASDEARYVTATEIVVDGGMISSCC